MIADRIMGNLDIIYALSESISNQSLGCSPFYYELISDRRAQELYASVSGPEIAQSRQPKILLQI